ncbi:MAG: dihydrolipoyl dehydrogenase [bacterium]
MSDYDVTVIGAGVAGYLAAIRLAQAGLKVCVVEKDKVGGTCLNRGCIPTKVLLHGIGLLSVIKKAGDFGVTAGDASLDFAKLMERKNQIVTRLVKGVEYLFQSYKIEVLKGSGKIIEPTLVEVTAGDKKTTLKAKHIIIATGSEPTRTQWIRFDEQVITSDEVLTLDKPPKSIMIIGGGSIGCEFAYFFNALGTEVRLIEIMPQLLPREDEEIALKITQILRDQGVKIYTRVTVQELAGKAGMIVGKLSSGEEIEAEKVLVATGRTPNTRNLGLENIGVKTEQGKVMVNDKLETSISGIYAVGDVVRGPMLAHKAYYDALVAAENIIGQDKRADYSSISSCLYTSPEIASVGMTEKDARQKYQINVGRFTFMGNGRAQTLGETEGFVKIISEANSGKILGAHLIGPQATELINGIVLAVKHNLTVSDLADNIYTHPTLSECIKEAAADAKGEAIHKVRKS